MKENQLTKRSGATPTYDCSRLADKLIGWQSLADFKKTMLEAIANIAVAVKDKDADRALAIQAELMWCYEVFDTIKEKGGGQ